MKNTISSNRMAGLEHCVSIGYTINQEPWRFPDIAEKFLGGKTCPSLAREYEIDKKFQLTEKEASEAVRHALRGWDASVRCIHHLQFPGLITRDAFQKIVTERQQAMRSAFGMLSVKLGNGIHAPSFTPKKRRAAWMKGQKVRGYVVFTHHELYSILLETLKPGSWRHKGSELIVNSASIASAAQKNMTFKVFSSVHVRTLITRLRIGTKKLHSKKLRKLLHKMLLLRRELLLQAT